MHAAGKHLGQGIRQQLERHVHRVDTGCLPEELTGHVRAAADAGRTHVELAGTRLGMREELGQRLHRKLLRDDQHVRERCDLHHHREVLDRPERQFALQQRRREVRRADQRHGVAVGRGPGDDLAAKDAARAGPVVDHHLLAPGLEQACAQRASEEIARRTRREGHHQPHRTHRVLQFGRHRLRRLHERDGRQAGDRRQAYDGPEGATAGRLPRPDSERFHGFLLTRP